MRGLRSLASGTVLAIASIISVELLNNASCILNDLWVTVRHLLSERINNVADAHLFEFLSALFVHAEISNREKSYPPG